MSEQTNELRAKRNSYNEAPLSTDRALDSVSEVMGSNLIEGKIFLRSLHFPYSARILVMELDESMLYYTDV